MRTSIGRAIAIGMLVMSLLTACATDATLRTTTSQLPGTYYRGDGLGRMVIVDLRPDGTFSSDWQGCLGVYGEVEGTWTLQDDQIVFASTSEHELLVGYLRQATTIQHDGRVGFARAQDVDNDKISEALVFFKQSGRR